MKRGAGPEHCPFCKRIAEEDYDASWLDGVTFEPLNPVTPGHRLFVTRYHEDPKEFRFTYESNLIPRERAERGLRPNPPRGVSAVLPLLDMWRKDRHITEDFNLILNAGEAASQSIEHLHLHYIPRRPGDGLILPWTGQRPIGESK
jgi:diadenosine tetraphosphate (Ap4A) HIT family hydrolase